MTCWTIQCTWRSNKLDTIFIGKGVCPGCIPIHYIMWRISWYFKLYIRVVIPNICCVYFASCWQIASSGRTSTKLMFVHLWTCLSLTLNVSKYLSFLYSVSCNCFLISLTVTSYDPRYLFHFLLFDIDFFSSMLSKRVVMVTSIHIWFLVVLTLS